MRLDRNRWILSEDEGRTLRRGRQSLNDGDDRSRRFGAPLVAFPAWRGGAPSWGSQWRVVLDPAITAVVANKGIAFFRGSQVYLPSLMEASWLSFCSRFDRLQFQPFGYAGAPGFFAGRRIAADLMVITPSVADESETFEDFLECLARAVIRALPDYDRRSECPVSWMITRHSSSVAAMPAHRDEVGWLVQFNIQRSCRVAGGVVEIYDNANRFQERHLLAHTLDGYILRDSDFLHGVSAMRIEPHPEGQHRDVLILRIPLGV